MGTQHTAALQTDLAACLKAAWSGNPGDLAKTFARQRERDGVSTDPELLKFVGAEFESALFENGRRRSARSAASRLKATARELVKRYSGDPPRADAKYFMEFFYSTARQLQGWSPDGTRPPTGALGMFLALAALYNDADIRVSNDDIVKVVCALNTRRKFGLGSDTDIRFAIDSFVRHVPRAQWPVLPTQGAL